MNSRSVVRLSAVLAGFLGVTFTLCVLYDLAVPASYRMYTAWDGLLPGFEGLNWGSFFIGLAEVLAYGVYAAVLLLVLRGAFYERRLPR